MVSSIFGRQRLAACVALLTAGALSTASKSKLTYVDMDIQYADLNLSNADAIHHFAREWEFAAKRGILNTRDLSPDFGSVAADTRTSPWYGFGPLKGRDVDCKDHEGYTCGDGYTCCAEVNAAGDVRCCLEGLPCCIQTTGDCCTGEDEFCCADTEHDSNYCCGSGEGCGNSDGTCEAQTSTLFTTSVYWVTETSTVSSPFTSTVPYVITNEVFSTVTTTVSDVATATKTVISTVTKHVSTDGPVARMALRSEAQPTQPPSLHKFDAIPNAKLLGGSRVTAHIRPKPSLDALARSLEARGVIVKRDAVTETSTLVTTETTTITETESSAVLKTSFSTTTTTEEWTSTVYENADTTVTTTQLVTTTVGPEGATQDGDDSNNGGSGSGSGSSEDDSSPLSSGAIAGVAIGGVAALALVGVGIWLCVRKRKNNPAGSPASGAAAAAFAPVPGGGGAQPQNDSYNRYDSYPSPQSGLAAGAAGAAPHSSSMSQVSSTYYGGASSVGSPPPTMTGPAEMMGEYYYTNNHKTNGGIASPQEMEAMPQQHQQYYHPQQQGGWGGGNGGYQQVPPVEMPSEYMSPPPGELYHAGYEQDFQSQQRR